MAWTKWRVSVPRRKNSCASICEAFRMAGWEGTDPSWVNTGCTRSEEPGCCMLQLLGWDSHLKLDWIQHMGQPFQQDGTSVQPLNGTLTSCPLASHSPTTWPTSPWTGRFPARCLSPAQPEWTSPGCHCLELPRDWAGQWALGRSRAPSPPWHHGWVAVLFRRRGGPSASPAWLPRQNLWSCSHWLQDREGRFRQRPHIWTANAKYLLDMSFSIITHYQPVQPIPLTELEWIHHILHSPSPWTSQSSCHGAGLVLVLPK